MTRLEWRQSLPLDTQCSPLYLQVLSTGTNNFVVVCNTETSMGYHVVSSSADLFQLLSLQIPDTLITDLIIGGFKPFLQPESDAFVYIRNGELMFATLFDGQAAVYIDLSYDTSCDVVVSVYPLPKPIEGQFRFILDCQQQQEPGTILRYKVTLPSTGQYYPESVHLLPMALASGTPISSLDSEYFAIVQETTIAIVRTEYPGTYRVHSFHHQLRDVTFMDTDVPTLAVVIPGQNHMLLQVEPFLTDYNTSTIELVGSPAFCPNQSHCLPHNIMMLPQANLFFTFTTTAMVGVSARYYNLLIYDLDNPRSALLEIQNLAVAPSAVLPKDISLVFPSTTTSMYQSTASLYQSEPTHKHMVSQTVPYHTSTTPALSESTSVHTLISNTRNTVSSTITVSDVPKSSSSAIRQTPTLNDSKDDKQLLSSNFRGTVTIIFSALVLVLLLVLVTSFLILIVRRQHRSSSRSTDGDHTLPYPTTLRDEEKMLPPPSLTNDSKPPSSAVINATNPTSLQGNDGIQVNTVSVPATQDSPVSRPDSVQLVTLDLKGSARTLTSSGDSSGVSSAASTPSTTSGGELKP